MSYSVVFHPKAKASLVEIYAYFAERAGVEIAEKLVSAIQTYCEGLKIFPNRGTRRTDLHPGLRTVGYKRKATIAFTVRDYEQTIVIQGIFYRGQDYERLIDIGDDGV